jgi:hypothetical protein
MYINAIFSEGKCKKISNVLHKLLTKEFFSNIKSMFKNECVLVFFHI